MSETVEITKEQYAQFQKDSEWLCCLEAAGVDNWDGYDYAIELWQERNPDGE